MRGQRSNNVRSSRDDVGTAKESLRSLRVVVSPPNIIELQPSYNGNATKSKTNVICLTVKENLL